MMSFVKVISQSYCLWLFCLHFLLRCSLPPFGLEAPARSILWLWAAATCSAGRGPRLVLFLLQLFILLPVRRPHRRWISETHHWCLIRNQLKQEKTKQQLDSPVKQSTAATSRLSCWPENGKQTKWIDDWNKQTLAHPLPHISITKSNMNWTKEGSIFSPSQFYHIYGHHIAMGWISYIFLIFLGWSDWGLLTTILNYCSFHLQVSLSPVHPAPQLPPLSPLLSLSWGWRGGLLY